MVDFNTFASEEKKDADMIKVTATIKNLSSRNDEFSLKAVLDTVLGEADQHHFYTWENVSVKNEVLYRTLQNQKWFVSKNGNAAMQLFFTGADCTTPELVALIRQSHVKEVDMGIMSVVCVLDGIPHCDGLGIDECVCLPTRGNIP